jgi:3-oxoacyl-[acyl-carrier protein] reductase
MDTQLKGKRALITGSSSGIGAAIAQELAREGVEVVVHGRNRDRAENVAEEINKFGRAKIAIGDLATDQGASDVAEQAIAAYGGIDILVNNAAGYGVSNWSESQPQQWADLYSENVLSMVRLILSFIPDMKSRQWGRLIQIGSVAGLMGLAESPDYGMGKAAILNMTASLAKELAPFGITSNTVTPGPIVTAPMREYGRQIALSEGRDSISDEELYTISTESPIAGGVKNPSQRFGLPEEVAYVVAMLASPRAGFVNGANVRVDGGLVPTISV